MPEFPDFDQIARQVISGSEYHIKRVAEQLRQVWNARGAADRERIGEIIGEQREPDYSLRMAQESIKALDR